MKQVEICLIPAPGQKPEFLAKLEPTDKTLVHSAWDQLPSTVVLEGYTRDAWSLDTATKWSTFQLESVDGRNKLPGFIKYLRDRQKTAYGRFGQNVMVIPFKQMSTSILNCRIAALDTIPGCPLDKKTISTNSNNNNNKPQTTTSTMTTNVPPLQSTRTTTKASSSSSSTLSMNNNKPPKKKGGFGLLGNLVGAQRRTNQQVETAATVVPPKMTTDAENTSSDGGTTTTTTTNNLLATSTEEGNGSTSTAISPDNLKTAGQLLADFRQEMEQEMLDFDISGESVLKVKLDLPAKLRLLTPEDRMSGRVTMEVLKYIVYEQAEEINEEWIAHKEPSEFMDEATIAIYKEGEAPPEVLEEINKAELPDEIRGQQRAIQEQRQKAEQLKAHRLHMEQTKAALEKKRQSGGENDPGDDHDFAALNTQKRDRRTIEDFERESKRRKED